MAGADWCWFHAPDRDADRRAARSRGGVARHGRTLATGARSVQLGSVADVVKVVERALSDLLSLENSIARARAVAQLAGAALKALELAQLEQRILALEQRQVTVKLQWDGDGDQVGPAQLADYG